MRYVRAIILAIILGIGFVKGMHELAMGPTYAIQQNYKIFCAERAAALEGKIPAIQQAVLPIATPLTKIAVR